MRVFLGGEGPNELGDLSRTPTNRGEHLRPGVLEVLLRKVKHEGWAVVDALRWKDLKHLRVGGAIKGNNETLNVLKLVHHAREARCDAVAFSRDRDGPRFKQRQLDVDHGIVQAGQQPDALGMIGGMAIEKLEAWLVALAGIHGTEDMGGVRLERELSQLGIELKSTGQYVAHAEAADLKQIPPDAASLRSFPTNSLHIAMRAPDRRLLRYSSVKYVQYSPSSRLAGQRPDDAPGSVRNL